MIAAWAFLGFALGSVPTAYLVVKAVKGIDIRTQGSGNVGATNAFRVIGKKWGSLVFILDFLKGWLPVFLFQRFSEGIAYAQEWSLLIGIAAMLGHIFTPFLGFKGGKGVATGAGVLCGAYPLLFLMAVAVWSAVFFATRIVSVSSIAALAALVILSLIFERSAFASALFFAVFVLIIWTHRSNLSRLKEGREKRF